VPVQVRGTGQGQVLAKVPEMEPALVQVPELVKVLALVSAHSQWLPAQIRPQSR